MDKKEFFSTNHHYEDKCLKCHESGGWCGNGSDYKIGDYSYPFCQKHYFEFDAIADQAAKDFLWQYITDVEEALPQKNYEGENK
jgi:hypothetical protein